MDASPDPGLADLPLRLTRDADGKVTATRFAAGAGRAIPVALPEDAANHLRRGWNLLADNTMGPPITLFAEGFCYRLLRLDRDHAVLQPTNCELDSLATDPRPEDDFVRLANDWFWRANDAGRLIDVISADPVLPPWVPQLVGRPLVAAIDKTAGDAEAVADALRWGAAFRNRTVRLVGTGTPVWLRMSAVPIRDDRGRVVEWRGSASDCSDLFQAVDDLRSARLLERLLKAAMQASPVNLTIADAREPDMPLLFVNRAFCETTGYAEEEVIGRNCRFLQGAGTDRATVTAMREAIRKGRPYRCEILNYRKDGKTFWNALDLAPVVDPDGSIAAYVGVQLDITADRERREHQQQQQRLEALGRLAGGVAHEINNLLQPALTLPELISDRLPEDAEDERDYLRIIADHARHARSVVADILAFARQKSAAEGPLPIGPTLAAALDFVRGVIPPTITIDRIGFETIGPEREVVCSATGLRQVLANLAVNAAHAMEGRGTVTVTVASTDQDFIVEVADTGVGMPPEVASQIFDPFFTTKRTGEGVGLGLATVYGIVDRWGGTIAVDSAPGAGTTFTICLPLCPPSTSTEAAAPAPVPATT